MNVFTVMRLLLTVYQVLPGGGRLSRVAEDATVPFIAQ